MIKNINLEKIKIREISSLDFKKVKEFQNYINSLVEERDNDFIK